MNRSRFKSKLQEAIRRLTDELLASIAAAIEQHPELTYREIAQQHGVSEATVLRAASRHGLSRPSGPKPRAVGTGHPIEEVTNG